jgi:hypothetical protein
VKVFACKTSTHNCVITVAFNKGHAVKLMARELGYLGLKLPPIGNIQEIDLETIGSVTILNLKPGGD